MRPKLTGSFWQRAPPEEDSMQTERNIMTPHGFSELRTIPSDPQRLVDTQSIVPTPKIPGAAVKEIVRPANGIPIARSLTGRKLIVHIGKAAIVLSAHEARRLAYALLLEAETIEGVD